MKDPLIHIMEIILQETQSVNNELDSIKADMITSDVFKKHMSNVGTQLAVIEKAQVKQQAYMQALQEKVVKMDVKKQKTVKRQLPLQGIMMVVAFMVLGLFAPHIQAEAQSAHVVQIIKVMQ